MRYKPEQKEQTRQRIIIAAAQSFRKAGYSGIGVDGLAKGASVTSGAFYGHFKSKEAVFKEVVANGLEGLYSAITDFKQQYGEHWWEEFADFYTSLKRTCDLTDACPLQTLTPEVGRSNEDIRDIFETGLLKVVKLASSEQADGASQEERDKIWASLAMLIGGVTLARAVSDEELSEEIGTAVRNEVVALQKPK